MRRSAVENTFPCASVIRDTVPPAVQSPVKQEVQGVQVGQLVSLYVAPHQPRRNAPSPLSGVRAVFEDLIVGRLGRR